LIADLREEHVREIRKRFLPTPFEEARPAATLGTGLGLELLDHMVWPRFVLELADAAKLLEVISTGVGRATRLWLRDAEAPAALMHSPLL
jgi:hypothetical protein